jgi:PII-like signaling protein
MNSSACLLRIYAVSGDRAGDLSLHEALVAQALQQGLRGACVLTGKMGYGRTTYFDEILADTAIGREPTIVEIIDTEERIQAFLPVVHLLVKGRRHVTMAPLTLRGVASQKG